MTAYVSQFGQDEFLDRFVFRGFRNGFFVDVGAHDGENFSNTLVFERDRAWKGLCIEPNPRVFERLRRVREAECLQLCIAASAGEAEFMQISGKSEMLSGIVSNYADKHRERIATQSRKDGSTHKVITVRTLPLATILLEKKISEVHFLSLDIEGGEYEALQSINFDKALIHAIAIENNYGDERIAHFLDSKGFVPLVRVGVDSIYVNRRSWFFSRWVVFRALALRFMARIERKLRKLRLLTPGAAWFPYKRPPG